MAQEILSTLTLEEKFSLLAGKQYWRTASLPHRGIKAIKFSDGPGGVRGESIHAATKSHCFPCGVCVGSTFNAALVYDMGVALARGCKTKNVGVLLGPTINLHRSPLSGRNSEAFSEDPTLTGCLGAKYVDGIQSQGVGACPKHFLGNECETERKTSNSVIDVRTMRELYAYPFQLILKEVMPLVIMASYNKVNGVWMSENEEILEGLLRKEWGFPGLVTSDWEGVYTQNAPVLAGLDLEMPGPPLRRAGELLKAIESGEVPLSKVDKIVTRVIELASKVGMEDEERPESIEDSPAISKLMYDIASEGIVLLKNKNNVLPLSIASSPRIAVFGSPAETPIVHGGGSPTLSSTYIITPLKALQERFGEANITYHPGVPIFRKIPSAPKTSMKAKSNGAPGLDCYWYNGRTIGENELYHEVLETTRTLVIDQRIKDLAKDHCTRMAYTLTPESSGSHTFGITSNGPTTLRVNGKETVHHPGYDDTQVEYIMQPGRFEVRQTMEMTAGTPYDIEIDSYSTLAPPLPGPFAIPPQATQVGFYENLNTPNDTEIDRLAAEVDFAFVFTGNNKEYESESFDRDDLALSAPQEALIRRVGKLAGSTIVVNQSGSPISMSWLDDVDAVIQSWFGGQEGGNALADIITGVINPSGRLPVSFPKRIEDSPSFGNFPTNSEGVVNYAEGLSMGYRSKGPEMLFPFGFGLSYSEFKVADLKVEGSGDCNAIAKLVVSNVGKLQGKETVQLYVDGILKSFTKLDLKPGESHSVELALDKYAFSVWNVEAGAWIAEPKTYKIEIKSDARSVLLESSYKIAEVFKWTGL